MMNVDKFWNIIDEVNEEVPYEHEKSLQNKNYVNRYRDEYVKCLKNKLSNLDFGDIILFQNFFDEYKGYLYRYDVWYECAWIFQHASDDGFEYFLRWIVSRGKKFYFSVCDDVKNIEKLEWESGYRHFESVSYVWIDVLREKYPDVLERIGDFIYNIDGLSRWEKEKIENEVKEAFKSGNNDEESEVGVNAGRMWEDEAMIKRWDEHYRELGIYENEKSEGEKVEIDEDDLPF